MKLGPKMNFILRVYQMTAAEAYEDAECDAALVRAGKMSDSIAYKRAATRSLARGIRRRDDYDQRWPQSRGRKPQPLDNFEAPSAVRH